MFAQCLAVDDLHLEGERVVRLKGAHEELGQIGEDGGLLKLLGQPAPALQRVVDLLDAGVERDVHGVDGCLGELAVRREAVALLVVLDGVRQALVERGWRCGCGRIAFELETRQQRGQRRVVSADCYRLLNGRQVGARGCVLLLREQEILRQCLFGGEIHGVPGLDAGHGRGDIAAVDDLAVEKFRDVECGAFAGGVDIEVQRLGVDAPRMQGRDVTQSRDGHGGVELCDDELGGVGCVFVSHDGVQTLQTLRPLRGVVVFGSQAFFGGVREEADELFGSGCGLAIAGPGNFLVTVGVELLRLLLHVRVVGRVEQRELRRSRNLLQRVAVVGRVGLGAGGSGRGGWGVFASGHGQQEKGQQRQNQAGAYSVCTTRRHERASVGCFCSE